MAVTGSGGLDGRVGFIGKVCFVLACVVLRLRVFARSLGFANATSASTAGSSDTTYRQSVSMTSSCLFSGLTGETQIWGMRKKNGIIKVAKFCDLCIHT